LTQEEGSKEGWIKLHKKKLHNIYSSSNIIRVITSKSMKELGYVAEMGREQKCIQSLR
jgi:hypothetical protein